MEALAALGLAANIAQFIGMAGKTIARTRALALDHKDLMKENEDLALIVSDFKRISPLLQDEAGGRIVESSELKYLAEAAMEICAEIDSKLESIKARRAKKKRVDNLYATWRELRLKDVFENLEKRLSGLRDQISMHISIILIQQQASVQSALVNTIKTSEDYMEKLSEDLAELKSHAIRPRDDDEDGLRLEWRGDSEQIYNLGRSLKSLMPHYESFHRTETILKSLYFRQVGERHDTIPQAHISTYGWVFEANTANFGPWLENSDAAIYWIAGRAGSGKSTLMKYVHKHHRMQMGLQRWAGKRQVLIASHFFWGSGTTMQKSQEGLLRTLTFQLLKQCPELISRAFPHRWKTALQHVDPLFQNDWTLKELLCGLTNILVEAQEFCALLFVDGLDEYSGDLDNLIEIVETLGKIDHVKICVSSRPWLEFSDAFSESPWKLYLHDLTRKDIERFTVDTLEAHSRFKLFKTRNPDASLELVSCITERAEGVFLWVQLAVRSLLRGIVNADNMNDLQRRLDEFPRQLEPFFERMLNGIDEFYKSQTAKVLLVLAHARVSLPLVTFYFLDNQDLVLHDPRRFLQNWPYVNEEEAEEVERKKRSLIAQFKDLINIYEHETSAALFNFSVGFIHRTVIEFISQSHIQEWLYQRAGSKFDPVTALFEVSLEQFKIFSHFWKHTYLHQYLRNWFLSAIYYAREIEVTKGQSVSQQLNQLQEVLSDDTDKGPFRRASKFEASWWRGDLKDIAISVGLWRYANDMAMSNDAEAALEPELCIELQSDFVVKAVGDDDRNQRCGMDIERPYYTSTLHMFTVAEADCLSDIRARRDKPETRDSYGSQVDMASEHGIPRTVRCEALPRSDIADSAGMPKVSRLKRFRKLRMLLK